MIHGVPPDVLPLGIVVLVFVVARLGIVFKVSVTVALLTRHVRRRNVVVLNAVVVDDLVVIVEVFVDVVIEIEGTFPGQPSGANLQVVAFQIQITVVVVVLSYN